MNPLILGPIFEIGKTLLDRFGPEDKTQRVAAEAELIRIMAQGELHQVIKQLEINVQEAQHPSIWVAGWRPFFGWVGGLGFLYIVLLKPLLTWASSIYGWPPLPDIDVETMMVVVTGMLGIGGLRTYEKVRNVTR
jgi:hypothetical protein